MSACPNVPKQKRCINIIIISWGNSFMWSPFTMLANQETPEKLGPAKTEM